MLKKLLYFQLQQTEIHKKENSICQARDFREDIILLLKTLRSE